MKGFVLCLVFVSYLVAEATADEDMEIFGDVCHIDGQTYLDGEKFINKDCTGYCTCHADSSGQGLSCVSLCPPMGIACAPGEEIEEYNVRVTGSGAECYCIHKRCVLAA